MTAAATRIRLLLQIASLSQDPAVSALASSMTVPEMQQTVRDLLAARSVRHAA